MPTNLFNRTSSVNGDCVGRKTDQFSLEKIPMNVRLRSVKDHQNKIGRPSDSDDLANKNSEFKKTITRKIQQLLNILRLMSIKFLVLGFRIVIVYNTYFLVKTYILKYNPNYFIKPVFFK